MAHPARALQEPDGQPVVGSAPPPKAIKPKSESALALPPSLPLILNARDMVLASDLRFVDVPATAPAPAPISPKKDRVRGTAVLRGLKELQQLQKQTIAVLEAVKSSLDDIQQVLRSPEATRGMEKQHNAATLLAKGFAREAVEQAQGAVALLPANPESHLLLALSLAADQQYDVALATARKGLLLFDRRSHPLAIEAGLLHALAALGCGAEAVERWGTIIDALPLPVLFDHMGRIASCFPTEASGGGEATLDDLINRRLARDEQNLRHAACERAAATRPGSSGGKIELRPDEIPAPALFAGLDAARDFHLPNTHRAVLGQIARRLQLVRGPAGEGGAVGGSESACGEVIKFLTECVVPLGHRNLQRVTDALGRAALRRLYHLQADAMMLHRAMAKLQMAGSTAAVREVSTLLRFWRKTGNKVVRARRALNLSLVLMFAGLGFLAYVLWGMGALAGQRPVITVLQYRVSALWIGPGVLAFGALVGVITLLGRTWEVPMPETRPPLRREELAYLNKNRHELHAR
jgi:hypothetical protein